MTHHPDPAREAFEKWEQSDASPALLLESVLAAKSAREYAIAAFRAGMLEAARMCEEQANKCLWCTEGVLHSACENNFGVAACAAAIRAAAEIGKATD